MTKAQQLHLATLAPYLPHAIEVTHADHGRGLLVGLPACHINDHGPLAVVRFDSAPSFPDYYELGSVKPVLYAPEDLGRIWDQALTAGDMKTTALLFQVTPEKLERAARQVDAARALGIALNLPAGSYIRKEVTHV